METFFFLRFLLLLILLLDAVLIVCQYSIILIILYFIFSVKLLHNTYVHVLVFVFCMSLRLMQLKL